MDSLENIKLVLNLVTFTSWNICSLGDHKKEISTIKSINPMLVFSYFLTQEHQRKQKKTARNTPHIKSSLTPGLQMPEV